MQNAALVLRSKGTQLTLLSGCTVGFEGTHLHCGGSTHKINCFESEKLFFFMHVTCCMRTETSTSALCKCSCAICSSFMNRQNPKGWQLFSPQDVVFEFRGMLSVVSPWRELETTIGVWESSELQLQLCAVKLVDKIPRAWTARRLSAVTQTQKYLTPNSVGAPAVSQSH